MNKLKEILSNFLCSIGIHNWEYRQHGEYLPYVISRTCKNCPRNQYKLVIDGDDGYWEDDDYKYTQ